MMVAARIVAAVLATLYLATLVKIAPLWQSPRMLWAIGIAVSAFVCATLILSGLFALAEGRRRRVAVLLSYLWLIYGMAALVMVFFAFDVPIRSSLAPLMAASLAHFAPGILWILALRQSASTTHAA